MSLILPKGIVVNSPEIEGSIESINTEPLDLADIAKFWKVYTTTKRRLLDPTAERLENYWWRIWGSRRRELNGATVASLFAHISNGESFVPLRGPANRDEGPPSWKRTAPGGSGASSTTALHRPSQSRPSTTSSSVSKSAMPHPILKKTRGPSTSGPRPTARFISPHESEDDPGDPTVSNSHVVVQPPSPDPPNPKAEKKATSKAGSKKVREFVSSPSAKRPVVFRRKSSQSSTESPSRSVETASSGLESSLETSLPAYLEGNDARSKQVPQSKFLENFSPANPLPSPSRNRQGAKNIDSRGQLPVRRDLTRNAVGPDTYLDDAGSSALGAIDRRRTSEADLARQEAIEARKTLHPDINATGAPRRSQSDMFRGSHRSASRDTGAMRYPSNDTKSTAILAPTLAAATGQVALSQAAAEPPQKISRNQDKGKRRASDEPKYNKPSSRRTTPAHPPTNGAEEDPSLARSKSQLALVLEKDRARRE